MILKPEQVAAAALLAGWSAQEVPTVVAVVKGESNFDTAARNACCSGLLQIHRTAHADKIKAAGGEKVLTDPIPNLKLGLQIWGGDWCGGRAPNGHCSKWEAYGLSNAGMSWQSKLALGAKAYARVQAEQRSGKSLNDILGAAGGRLGAPGDDGGGLGGIIDTAGSIAGTGKAMVDFGNRLGAWVGDASNWVRVGEVILGGLLIGIGLRLTFNAEMNAVAKKVATAVIPTQKAATVAGMAQKGQYARAFNAAKNSAGKKAAK